MNEQHKPKSRRPDYRVWMVTGEGKEAAWTDIGAAWSTPQGKGFSVALKAVPLAPGRIVMLPPKLLPANEGGQQ